MEKPQKKSCLHHWRLPFTKGFSKVFFFANTDMASKYLNSQTERRQSWLRETKQSPELCILIAPFPSLFELLSRQAGHERNASINTVPPSFTALPCPPTQGHKPAFNTQVYPEVYPQTSAKRNKTKKCDSHTSRWGKQKARHAEVSCFSSVYFFQSPQNLTWILSTC